MYRKLYTNMENIRLYLPKEINKRYRRKFKKVVSGKGLSAIEWLGQKWE